MKKFAITALTLALTVFGASAIACDGPGMHGGKGPEKRLEKMSEHLGLNDAQRAQLKAHFESQDSKRQAMQEESKAALAKILTPEQMAKHEEMRAKHHDEKKDKKDGKDHQGHKSEKNQ